jgi:hypothetical protein
MNSSKWKRRIAFILSAFWKIFENYRSVVRRSPVTTSSRVGGLRRSGRVEVAEFRSGNKVSRIFRWIFFSSSWRCFCSWRKLSRISLRWSPVAAASCVFKACLLAATVWCMESCCWRRRLTRSWTWSETCGLVGRSGRDSLRPTLIARASSFCCRIRSWLAASNCLVISRIFSRVGFDSALISALSSSRRVSWTLL